MPDTKKCAYCGKIFNEKMRLCPYCGGERIKEIIRETPVCPICKVEMTNYSYRENDIDICPDCNGLWLDIRKFNYLTSEREVFKDDAIPHEFHKKPLQKADSYLSCPVCNSLMPRINFKKISGVLIDVCRDHGVWLDPGELEQIRCFIANGGLHEVHDKEILVNREAIESLDTRLSDVEFMQKLLHHWKFKRWIFS